MFPFQKLTKTFVMANSVNIKYYSFNNMHTKDLTAYLYISLSKNNNTTRSTDILSPRNGIPKETDITCCILRLQVKRSFAGYIHTHEDLSKHKYGSNSRIYKGCLVASLAVMVFLGTVS